MECEKEHEGRYAAAYPRNQYYLACFYLAPCDQRPLGCQTIQGNRGRLFRGQRLRLRIHVGGRHDHLLGVGAVVRETENLPVWTLNSRIIAPMERRIDYHV